jgi:hypothetical protein
MIAYGRVHLHYLHRDLCASQAASVSSNYRSRRRGTAGQRPVEERAKRAISRRRRKTTARVARGDRAIARNELGALFAAIVASSSVARGRASNHAGGRHQLDPPGQ